MLLTMKENRRLKVIQEIMSRRKTRAEGAEAMELSERQLYRILAKVRAGGAFGVIHGNRGKMPWNKTPASVKESIKKLRKTEYQGFNDRHFADELYDEEGVMVKRETVRKILREAGIAAEKRAKKRKHRCRRPRKERFGEMLQGDASIHDWLEGKGPRLALVHFVDDATGYQWADFFPSETTEAYMRVIWKVLKKQGIPRMLYVDNHAIFRVNREETMEEQLSGRRPLTQFARAMEELAIPIMYAGSPQAKGRVERHGGLDQDRLVSELRKAKASTLEEARAVLRRYLPKSNRRFAKKPAQAGSAFIPLPEGCDVKQILCWKEERTVANDNTISYHGKKLQIPKSPLRQTFAKIKVAVHLCLDGSVHVFHKRQRIAHFPRPGIDPEMVPIVPIHSGALAAHSPTLTFSLGH